MIRGIRGMGRGKRIKTGTRINTDLNGSRRINLKKAVGTRKSRKRQDNCGFTAKSQPTVWVKLRLRLPLRPSASSAVKAFKIFSHRRGRRVTQRKTLKSMRLKPKDYAFPLCSSVSWLMHLKPFLTQSGPRHLRWRNIKE